MKYVHWLKQACGSEAEITRVLGRERVPTYVCVYMWVGVFVCVYVCVSVMKVCERT